MRAVEEPRRRLRGPAQLQSSIVAGLMLHFDDEVGNWSRPSGWGKRQNVVMPISNQNVNGLDTEATVGMDRPTHRGVRLSKSMGGKLDGGETRGMRKAVPVVGWSGPG